MDQVFVHLHADLGSYIPGANRVKMPLGLVPFTAKSENLKQQCSSATITGLRLDFLSELLARL